MSFTFARYEAAGRDSRGPTPGARALYAHTHKLWNFTTMMGIYNYRSVRGGSSLSHHAEGRALDIGIPTLGPSRADAAKGIAIVNAIGPIGAKLGIDHIIYNRRAWAARYPQGKRYTGTAPHYDHIHVGLTRQAAASLTVAAIAELIGDSTGSMPEPSNAAASDLEAATHRVSGVTNFLNLRDAPGVASNIIGELDPGAAVEQLPDEPREIEGTEWTKIRTNLNNTPIQGWVATKYLQPTGAVPRRKEKAKPAVTNDVQAATHRVSGVTNFLNLRDAPGVASNIIGELDPGAAVEQLPDEPREIEGTEWTKIRTNLNNTPIQGWVATKYLQPTGA